MNRIALVAILAAFFALFPSELHAEGKDCGILGWFVGCDTTTEVDIIEMEQAGRNAREKTWADAELEAAKKSMEAEMRYAQSAYDMMVLSSNNQTALRERLAEIQAQTELAISNKTSDAMVEVVKATNGTMAQIATAAMASSASSQSGALIALAVSVAGSSIVGVVIVAIMLVTLRSKIRPRFRPLIAVESAKRVLDAKGIQYTDTGAELVVQGMGSYKYAEIERSYERNNRQ